jgi:hypothetical protein
MAIAGSSSAIITRLPTSAFDSMPMTPLVERLGGTRKRKRAIGSSEGSLTFTIVAMPPVKTRFRSAPQCGGDLLGKSNCCIQIGSVFNISGDRQTVFSREDLLQE